MTPCARADVSTGALKTPVPWLRPIVVDPAGHAVAPGDRRRDPARRLRQPLVGRRDRHRGPGRPHARRSAAARARGRRGAARLLARCRRPPRSIAARAARAAGARTIVRRSPMPPSAGATPTFRRASARPPRSTTRLGYSTPVVDLRARPALRRDHARRAEATIATNWARSTPSTASVDAAGRPAAWARGVDRGRRSSRATRRSASRSRRSSLRCAPSAPSP